MSQNSTVLPTTGTVSGLTLAQDINLALDSIASHFSGPADPGAIGAYRFWADTTSNTLKQRNAANSAWVVTGLLSTQAWVQASNLAAGAVEGAVTAPLSFRNKLINGNFSINQRAVSGTVTLAAGAYGHDRFKAGAGGCTYTFATVNNVTTLTISAGTLLQIIEGAFLLSGTHTASWAGTAQARIDSGAYGASGIQGTAVGGTNQQIEWGTGTVSLVQYERGTVATPFENRDDELRRCHRYYFSGYGALTYNNTGGANTVSSSTFFPVYMRVVPTVTVTNGTINNTANNFTSTYAATSSGAWYAPGVLTASAEL